jgi:metal-responsive CopG/Arc/MetJ family transcriptional regulator
MKTMREKIKARMQRDRPMTMISIRLPEDLIEDLKEMAQLLGYSGYQPLIRAYIGKGMREDEAIIHEPNLSRLREVLQSRGMDSDEIEAVAAEISSLIQLPKRA